ncbi:MAG: crossover junction endodeoxyribonuclease RuvC [Acidobacteria bacterium]|jgi:crossover junction endodeoxyribonuclease RuvC|nr:crossover junction endodeoxyribonuclease RuvC [Acidobacteriota bacterium]
MMLILGLDPGSLRFGIGIVNKEKRRFSYVHSETIHLKSRDFIERMRELLERLDRVLAAFPVQQAAMEEGFLGKNIRSMALLSTVRGVAMAALLQHGLPLGLYAPRQVKLALTGYGSADKEQVAKMAAMVLGIQGRNPGLDESDALAVAYCHGVNAR